MTSVARCNSPSSESYDTYTFRLSLLQQRSNHLRDYARPPLHVNSRRDIKSNMEARARARERERERVTFTSGMVAAGTFSRSLADVFLDAFPIDFSAQRDAVDSGRPVSEAI